MGDERWALFDFCETLADFQTADAFVNFVRRETNDRRMRVLEKFRQILSSTKIVPVIDKITNYKININKRLLLYQLKGKNKEDLERLAEQYYLEKVKPHLINEMISILSEIKSANYNIMLVSGGYDIYLKCFKEDYGVDDILSTRIKFDERDVCEGKFWGRDCMNIQKVNLLKKRFGGKPSFVKAFSDSKSDLPLLLWADDSYVVSRNCHQTWVDKYNLKEIIWKDYE